MKKRKMMKRIISLLLTVAMVAGLCACGKKTDSNKNKTDADSKQYVYSMEEMPIDLGTDDISDICLAGEYIYAMAYNYVDGGTGEGITPRTGTDTEGDTTEAEDTSEADTTEGAAFEKTMETATATAITTEEVPADEGEYVDNSVTELLVGIYKLDGTESGNFKITLPQNSGSNGFTADAAGNVFIVLDEYGKNNSDPENVTDAYTLISYNSQGEENWRIPLGEDIKAGEYYYVQQMITNADGDIVIRSNLGLDIYGTDGAKKNSVEMPDTGGGNLLTLKDGSIALLSYGDTSVGVQKLDMTTGKLSETIAFPFNSYSYNYSSGGGYDLYMTDSNGIYGYNLGDETYTKIMDYVDSDIMASNLYNIRSIDESSFIACYYDETDSSTVCAKFTKVDPSAIKDKIVMTLGCNYIDSDVRKHVVEYNKSNTDYRIKVVDYSSYNTNDDYMAGQNKMNTDIASGNMPDILLTNTSMPLESYMEKGLFADLTSFFEKDGELKKEDYLSNIWDALSKDGKLYQIAPSFYVFSVFGKTSEVGSEPGWTLDDLQNLMKTKGEGVSAFNDITRQDMVNYSMWFCSDQFIDWDTGKCSFNTEAFTKLLEFANQYPEKIDYPEGDDNSYWENYQTMYREGRALLMMYTIASFEDYNQCEQGTFGEEITPIGFPTDNKNGSALNFNMNLAISSKSKNQEAAWQFVRYFLTDEYQDNIEWCWPVKYKQIEERAKKAQEKPFYLDENGQKVEYDNTYFLNGAEITIEPMTQEKTDKVLSFVESVTRTMSYNTSVTDIIQEETASYFSGQKTAQEVADIIQSRIQIYVNENR